MNTIGKNIRHLRQKLGKSQGEIAVQLGISIPAYSKMETGITDINISRLMQISKIHNVNPSTIIFPPGECPGDETVNLIKELKLQVAEKDAQVIKLQRKVIDLYEELGNKKPTKTR